jgi:ribonucleoside-diphosphate reductase alpha chain
MLLINEVPELTNHARRVLEARYLIRNADGEVTETPDQMFRRVAANVSRSELSYGASESDRLRWEETRAPRRAH